MNIDRCANCLLHGWTEVEDPTTLQRCKRCKLIKYCGRDCQTEHWHKVHHKQCKYFADPAKAQQWDHTKEACSICRQSAVLGLTQLMRPDNPNYECIFELVNNLPPHMLHPHPFPAVGDPEDIYEKSILVLWQLLDKFVITQSGHCALGGVICKFREEFQKVWYELKVNRLLIWLNRKISPKPQFWFVRPSTICIDLSAMDQKVQESGLIPDALELWKIIKVVEKISLEVELSRKWNLLINPMADMPSDLHAAASQIVINSSKFLATANEVLDALASQVIPYRAVLAIICGGSLEQACSFCSKQITIADMITLRRTSLTGPFARFGLELTTMFCCGSNSCLQKANSMEQDLTRSITAMTAVERKRGRNNCDLCFKLPPSGDVHRCKKCLSVMYCSTDCEEQDWDIHKKVCKEDVEERKKKSQRSTRRKEGKEALKSLEKTMKDKHIQEASEVLGKFKLKKTSDK